MILSLAAPSLSNALVLGPYCTLLGFWGEGVAGAKEEWINMHDGR